MSAAVLIRCDRPGCEAATIVEGTRSTVAAMGRAITGGWGQDLRTGAVSCPTHALPDAHDDLVERQQCFRCADGDHQLCSRVSGCTCACRDRGTGRIPRVTASTSGATPW